MSANEGLPLITEAGHYLKPDRLAKLEQVAEAAQRAVDEARFGGDVTLGFPDLVEALAHLEEKQ